MIAILPTSGAIIMDGLPYVGGAKIGRLKVEKTPPVSICQWQLINATRRRIAQATSKNPWPFPERGGFIIF
jgi:hypothetical protein